MSGEAYIAPGRSALAHWRAVLACTVIGLLIGVGYGIVRSPTYTAQAELYVGKTLSLQNTAAIPGLAQAATEIAGDYSRLILTSTVQRDAARRLGDRHGLPGSLSATQIPNSPEILVDAKASTEREAVALADAGSEALIYAVDQLNKTSKSQLQALLHQYQQLEQTIEQDQQQIQPLQTEIDRLEGSGAPASAIAPLQARLTSLQTDVSTDTLQATTVESQYQNQYAPLQAEEQVLNRLSPAMPEGSNRLKILELGGIVGLVGGLLVGVAGASVRDIWASRNR